MKIYNKKIRNEIPKDITPKCFLGAWYYKVFSSNDYWSGIEGTIKLPMVNLKRFNDKGDNLDTSSIYMGGQAKYESDVGLAFMKGLKGDENITNKSVCFRPFWRYITDLDNDEGGYNYDEKRFYSSLNLTPNKQTSNCYAQYSPKFTKYYYLPGDKLKIMITYPKKNFMQLTIKVIEISTLDYSVELRKKYNWDNPEDFKSPLFSSPESKDGKIIFKRVNAIDQRGNEGKNVIKTSTNVVGAKWESVYLYRVIDGTEYKIPFNSNRGTIMNCPEEKFFEATNIGKDDGSQSINIYPK